MERIPELDSLPESEERPKTLYNERIRALPKEMHRRCSLQYFNTPPPLAGGQATHAGQSNLQASVRASGHMGSLGRIGGMTIATKGWRDSPPRDGTARDADPGFVWVWNNVNTRDKMRRKSTSNIQPYSLPFHPNIVGAKAIAAIAEKRNR